MTFDSLTFAVFLALTYAAHWAVRPWRARKVFLLIASYLFYAAWNPFFVLLIVATTGFDWFAARWMDRSQEQTRRKLLLAASITVNLSALGFFKYAQFFTDSAIDLLRILGVEFRPLSLGILLPVGISFYTFESLSYVIDVYRRRIERSKSLLDYSLYVTFFPHLIAGPILRYDEFAPQCTAEKIWRSTSLGRGLTLLMFGLALKVCLADLVFAPVADPIFAHPTEAGFGEAWLGASAFSLQVYCDFAGYSLCAIGTALMFGFRFPMNFESPFGSIGITDLWTRWHMSLARWMRDYVFAQLGGYRKGRARGSVNVLVTFLAVGLWHGAAWTFVVWGALHGAFIVAERFFRDAVWDFSRSRHAATRVAIAIVTFALFTLAVVFFRAPSVAQAMSLVATMFMPWRQSMILTAHAGLIALVAGAVMIGAQIRFRDLRGWDWLDQWSIASRAMAIALALTAIIFSPGFNPAFIYFQF